MNKMWVWVGFPFGLGVLLLLIVLMSSEAGADVKYRSVMTEAGRDAKIGFIDQKPGTGDAVKEGDSILLSFSVKVAGRTSPPKPPERFEVGSKATGPGMFGLGFDAGLVGIKVGGSREIIVPPELIPPQLTGGKMADSEIVFDVKVHEILPPNLPPNHPVIPKKPRDQGDGAP